MKLKPVSGKRSIALGDNDAHIRPPKRVSRNDPISERSPGRR